MTTLLQWFRKLLMIFWVQFWNASNSVLWCNDLRISRDFLESSSENFACHLLLQCNNLKIFSWFLFSSVLKILLVISTLMQRFDKILMTFLSPVLKNLLAISTLMQRFEKFLMIYVVQFWRSVLCCNDLRSFSWFVEFSSENACNRFFAATIWEVCIEFLVQFWKCSQSILRCEHLRSLSWILSPFLKRRAIQYLAAKNWEVSHYFCVQFWKYLQSIICCCEDLKSLSWVFESSSKNACNQYFAASIWENFHDFFESSSETACDQYFAATIWEVSHDFQSTTLIASFFSMDEKVLGCDKVPQTGLQQIRACDLINPVIRPFLKKFIRQSYHLCELGKKSGGGVPDSPSHDHVCVAFNHVNLSLSIKHLWRCLVYLFAMHFWYILSFFLACAACDSKLLMYFAWLIDCSRSQ